MDRPATKPGRRAADSDHDAVRGRSPRPRRSARSPASSFCRRSLRPCSWARSGGRAAVPVLSRFFRRPRDGGAGGAAPAVFPFGAWRLSHSGPGGAEFPLAGRVGRQPESTRRGALGPSVWLIWARAWRERAEGFACACRVAAPSRTGCARRLRKCAGCAPSERGRPTGAFHAATADRADQPSER